MKYSLCIEPIFEDVPFLERFQIAKDLGCDAVEFWDPWASTEEVVASERGGGQTEGSNIFGVTDSIMSKYS